VEIGTDAILKAAQITLTQGETKINFADTINFSHNESFVVSVPYASVPKNLKSIIVSIQNPSNNKEVSSYLLKLNQAGDAYVARVSAPNVEGQARITVEVFDYKLETVRRISTVLSFTDKAVPVPIFPDRLLELGWYFFVPQIVIVSSFAWYWFLLRRKHRRD
jgi:dihydroorotate dehydrogenase